MEVELFSELVDGELTIHEFEIRSNSTVSETSASIGLDQLQATTLESAIVAKNQEQLIYKLKEAQKSETKDILRTSMTSDVSETES